MSAAESPLGVLIVDDEPLARARLARQLQTIDGCQLLGEAADGESALQQLDSLDPDLLLLDIEMPGENGLQLAAQITARPNPPAIIFCTAHDEFALPAFAVAPSGYLLKPVSVEQLAQAIAQARRLSKPQRQALHTHTPQSEPPPASGRRQIKAVSRRGVQLLDVDDIRCFIAEDKYVIAHHSGGETLLDESLKELEAEFGERFVRVHRNAIVAQDYITGLQKTSDGYRVSLRGVPLEPAVSRRLLGRIKSLLSEMA
ncbi:LytR/AlgR family response regulator transcription factor [Microbulbifer harenosus]|uniref:Response regulator transcription factor n=1 Tax=Microbulbifer harenosus TaxID=2576840 RepID=A0ABY2UD53_9GAMM|nr:MULTISPECIES: LytTR family DNA-binding domain-containing protein [Microbulbifer]QIL90538.1 response regulator [Microbulbifer sp. SH-1]TLM74311.1 response regulator transcription factor [Microbulbifer harenosus]